MRQLLLFNIALIRSALPKVADNKLFLLPVPGELASCWHEFSAGRVEWGGFLLSKWYKVRVGCVPGGPGLGCRSVAGLI